MITLRTPGALLIASQGDCAALTITALIATSTDAATGPPTAGATPTGAPLFTVGTTPSPPRGSVVGIDMIAANSGVTVTAGFVGLVGGATALLLFEGSVGGAVGAEGSALVGATADGSVFAGASGAAVVVVVAAAASAASAAAAAEASVAAASVAAASVAAASVEA